MPFAQQHGSFAQIHDSEITAAQLVALLAREGRARLSERTLGVTMRRP
jgi:hypothetical protein